ncbi:MAG: undecaprenyl-diphosphate phosphatase [Phycisphaerae bacterium]|nr:undecaprenyl-diphosphate phosphatase [Phycisphaerae bacterium]
MDRRSWRKYGLVPLFLAAAASPGWSAEPAAPAAGMSLADAAILGVVEGVTEYLPVSSTGHLILTQKLMGLGGDGREQEAAGAYAICIQAGAIVAVLGLYFGRVRQMVVGIGGKDAVGRRLAINIIAAFIPAAVIGLLINDWIKEHLFGGGRFGIWPVVGAWFVGGLAILAVGWWRRYRKRDVHVGTALEQLQWAPAMVIGLAQCLAMWPGVSRSLVTIVAGVLVGLGLSAAVEFSFLLGVLTLGAATAYDAMKHGDVMLEAYGAASLVIGFLASAISAAVAVKWMVAYLNRHGLAVFGYYRVVLAVVVGGLILGGVLSR